MVAGAFSWLAVLLSFVFAGVLELVALPDMLRGFRPEWLVLTQMYWLLRRPDKVGISFAFCIGLVMDVMAGSYFGIHAMALCLVTYLVLGMHKRFKMFPMGQQAAIMFIVTGVHLMIVYSLRAALSYADNGLDYLWQAFVSALVWPLLLVFYDRLVFMLR
ncbi:MAG: rod shape-determining protein MreD [Oleiphilus sp.]|nr:MAG: rod shape-determining protein MreD [Oleiphilus sp.]